MGAPMMRQSRGLDSNARLGGRIGSGVILLQPDMHCCCKCLSAEQWLLQEPKGRRALNSHACH